MRVSPRPSGAAEDPAISWESTLELPPNLLTVPPHFNRLSKIGNYRDDLANARKIGLGPGLASADGIRLPGFSVLRGNWEQNRTSQDLPKQ